jgi:hypothetical protein
VRIPGVCFGSRSLRCRRRSGVRVLVNVRDEEGLRSCRGVRVEAHGGSGLGSTRWGSGLAEEAGFADGYWRCARFCLRARVVRRSCCRMTLYQIGRAVSDRRAVAVGIGSRLSPPARVGGTRRACPHECRRAR